jgi:predicted nucleic acid-binding protein
MSYTAFLDSNVVYSAMLRDILVQLAVADLVRLRWSADVHREWMGKLLKNEPQLDRARLERTRDLMDRHVRDSMVKGYQSLIPSLILPDSNDRHILAAAIVGRCDVIVTKNLRDFPTEILAEYGIEAQHPDEFLLN